MCVLKMLSKKNLFEEQVSLFSGESVSPAEDRGRLEHNDGKTGDLHLLRKERGAQCRIRIRFEI